MRRRRTLFPHRLPVPAGAADKDRDLARRLQARRHHPPGKAPHPQIVEAKVAAARRTREIVQHGKDGQAAPGQIARKARQAGMVDGTRRDGLTVVRQRRDLGREIARRLGGGEADLRADADIAAGRTGASDLFREALVEGLPALVQHEAKRDLRQAARYRIPERRGQGIADPHRRLGHLHPRAWRHVRPVMQDPVDGGDAKTRFAGQRGDRRLAGHPAPGVRGFHQCTLHP